MYLSSFLKSYVDPECVERPAWLWNFLQSSFKVCRPRSQGCESLGGEPEAQLLGAQVALTCCTGKRSTSRLN